MSEVVALLLDDAMPPERLGALLRGARKRSGLKRKQAAAAAGTTAAKLRAYERGDQPVPAAVCAQLAECYGDDLTAHVPLRVPPQVEHRQITIGDVRQPVGPDADDVLAGYVDILHRLRDIGPGDPLALRAVDIVALAGALGLDREVIEQRISEVLGCTRTEAARLHGALLRRKVILPVAGLAAGMAAFAGSAAVAQPSPSGSHVPAVKVSATAPASTPARVERAGVTTPTTAKPAPTTTVPTTPTTVAVEPKTDATVPPSQRQAEVPIAVAPPRADPADPSVSVLPGETPITVIGTPDSTDQTP
jgi:transcriptional regulator with XRE-family HTH domain